jgi:hypothetical protein
MACPQVADGGTATNMEGSCEYSRGQPTSEGPPAWGLDEMLTTTHLKTGLVTKRIELSWA